MLDWANWELQLQGVALVALAGALGAAIGLERERKRKPAGLRTHTAVAAGAALLMVLGEMLIARYRAVDAVAADPIRIMQAIVVGISFLGAGTIIRHRQGDQQQIEGLTTAASILLVAGLGMAVAVGQLILAGGVTALTLLMLWVLGRLERR